VGDDFLAILVHGAENEARDLGLGVRGRCVDCCGLFSEDFGRRGRCGVLFLIPEMAASLILYPAMFVVLGMSIACQIEIIRD
jgi:hypothetical protein